MSAAQERPRRTSARVNDTNDDDGPPAKKAKTDKTRAPPAKATNGRKGGVAASGMFATGFEHTLHCCPYAIAGPRMMDARGMTRTDAC